jgi:photosystem I subunit 10
LYKFINAGDKILLYSTFLALQVASARAVDWTPTIGLIMTACCLFAVAIGRFAIRKKGVGPKLPVETPALFSNFGVPELLATMSFGHILGAGVILGLTNAGVL